MGRCIRRTMRQFFLPTWLFIACCAFAPYLQSADLPAAQPNISANPLWSQSLQLSGITSTEGEYCVYLFNPTTGTVTTLTLGEPPYNGLKLEALHNSDDPARCSVVVSRYGAKALLRPIDSMTAAPPLLASKSNSATEATQSEDSDAKPALIREWKGPRFDLKAALEAAAASKAQEN